MNITFINTVRSRRLSPTGNIHDDIDRVKLCIERKDYTDYTIGPKPFREYIPALETSIRKYIIAKHILNIYRHKKYMVKVDKLLVDLGI